MVDRPPRATSHLMRDSFILVLALLQHVAVPPELEDDHQQNALCHRGTACHARLLNRPVFLQHSSGLAAAGVSPEPL